jgi:hypothetical protein
MKIINKIFSIAILILEGLQPIQCQDSGDAIIWKALKDEVKRDMDSLHTMNGPKPCFISVKLDDVYSIYVNATLGGIVQSDENTVRSWGDRLLVGTYKLNDENFTGMNNNDQPRMEPDNLPVENDYDGIRRTYWLSLDKVYRSASLNYNEKLECIHKKEADGSAIEIADFSEAPNIISKDVPVFLVDSLDRIEKFVSNLSGEFIKYPSLINSSVQFNLVVVSVYFVNSEGTEVKNQIPIVKLSTHAGIYDDFGSSLSDGIQYCAKDFKSLPSLDRLRNDIHSLADYLDKLSKAPHFDESYNGPVLLEGQSSMKSFLKALFNNENSLIAYREELISTAQNQLYYSRNRNSLETKIGKNIAPKSFTIKDMPGLQKYNNTVLIGGYKIDAEGVVPPDTMVLIENGILRNLLSSRTPSRTVPASNGHRRYSISQAGTTEQVAPGNIMIITTDGQSKESLKQKLINDAKDLGLDYAFIVRPLIESDGSVPEQVIRINIETGKEELIRANYQPDMNNVSFRDLASCSKSSKAFNFLYTGSNTDAMNIGGGGASMTLRGIPMSLITPESVLISKGKINGDKKPIAGHKPEVPNPLE